MTARSALRRYMLVGFLTWLPPGLQMTVMVLLMSERGLGLAEIGLVTMVFSVVTVSLELPTGGLSDVVGRRVVLAVSAAFTVVALVLMSVSTTFWMFLASGVLKGVARALSSGPATSWYVDTLHAVEGREADIKPGLAKGAMMESAALCAGVLGGGCLPLLVPPSLMFPPAAPPLAGAVAAGALFVVALFALPEPAGPRGSLGGVLREVPATVAGGVRLAAGAPVLRRMMGAARPDGDGRTADRHRVDVPASGQAVPPCPHGGPNGGDRPGFAALCLQVGPRIGKDFLRLSCDTPIT